MKIFLLVHRLWRWRMESGRLPFFVSSSSAQLASMCCRYHSQGDNYGCGLKVLPNRGEVRGGSKRANRCTFFILSYYLDIIFWWQWYDSKMAMIWNKSQKVKKQQHYFPGLHPLFSFLFSLSSFFWHRCTSPSTSLWWAPGSPSGWSKLKRVKRLLPGYMMTPMSVKQKTCKMWNSFKNQAKHSHQILPQEKRINAKIHINCV